MLRGACAHSDGLPVGFVLISVIAFWNFVLGWLIFRFPRLARLAGEPAGPVSNNLKREFLSDEGLDGKMTRSKVWKSLALARIGHNSGIRCKVYKGNGNFYSTSSQERVLFYSH
jgi:hypothetical protein